MHEFSSNVNKVNKIVAKVRTIGDRLPLITIVERNFKKATLKTEREVSSILREQRIILWLS